jgi:hypothetical protein
MGLPCSWVTWCTETGLPNGAPMNVVATHSHDQYN